MNIVWLNKLKIEMVVRNYYMRTTTSRIFLLELSCMCVDWEYVVGLNLKYVCVGNVSYSRSVGNLKRWMAQKKDMRLESVNIWNIYLCTNYVIK